MSNLKQIVTARLRAAREDAGLTQNEVADLLGIKRNTYTQIENGKNALSIEYLVKLPEILGKPVNYFLGVGTKDLTAQELELLELFRSVPPGDLKDNLLNIARATALQVRAAESEFQKPSIRELWKLSGELTPEQRAEISDRIAEMIRQEKEERPRATGNELPSEGGA